MTVWYNKKLKRYVSARTGNIVCSKCKKGYGSEVDGLCRKCRGGLTAYTAKIDLLFAKYAR